MRSWRYLDSTQQNTCVDFVWAPAGLAKGGILFDQVDLPLKVFVSILLGKIPLINS